MHQTFSQRVSTVVATALGSGFSPVAPGTAGTLVAVPLVYAVAGMPDFGRMWVWIALFAAGSWAAKVYCERTATADNQEIVIDEVVGYAIAAWTAGREPLTLVVAFALFRFFDVMKLPPVREVDRWSKNQTSWGAGIGVMLDDVIAGLQALVLILLAQKLGYLP